VDPDSKSGGRPPARLAVSVTDGRGRAASAPGLARWLARVAPRSAPPEITLALVSAARIRALNRRFRHTDAVTDVLSFEPSDIAIAAPVARRQARAAGHSYADELKVLALHGLLHLMGYDHHAPSDRGRMARIEQRLRANGGLNHGLIERARKSRGEPAARREPAKRRASDAVRESEGRSPSVRK
jgi:probable rRNA maturation factor